jgi:hypothetical protein
MTTYKYCLGNAASLEQLFPPPEYAERSLDFKSYADVIRHYTLNSLYADGMVEIDSVTVTLSGGEYFIEIIGTVPLELLTSFGDRHAKIFSAEFAQKAIKGKALLEELGVWNPMSGYKVNANPSDDLSKWHLFPPLGLNVIGQKGLLLMHYPPWAVIQAGTFENAMTMKRWGQLLMAAGIPEHEVRCYKTIVDVNPIAAPGSGESEYPNDYMPIMMASGFFDGPPERDYIRSMLELYLSPPSWPKENKYTLPLLICGSPLYDPQAPGWFRVAYKHFLPAENQIPQVKVLQAGKFRVRPDSARETPYLICNHMIAAGVTGKCTDNPAVIPDIRQYEAQDLVAATFLKLYTENPNIDPEVAKAQACEQWYGNRFGIGAPLPKQKEDQRTLCAMAQMDMFFNPVPSPHPQFTFAEAWQRCADATETDNPCFGNIKPTGR